MPSRRPNLATIIITEVICLVICAVVVGELPELLTLTDSTSNDFVVSKISTPRGTAKPSGVRFVSVKPSTAKVVYGEYDGWTNVDEGMKPASHTLYILFRTLRT
jgi:hypothetical protein